MGDRSGWDERVQLTLAGVAYSVHVQTRDNAALKIEVEQVDDATTWTGDFAAKCAAAGLGT